MGDIKTVVDSINHDIEIEFDDEKQVQIIYDAVLLEFETSPDYRSSMDIELDGKSILIHINANDATSYRASINSAIKWIRLSLEVNNLTI
ncbi:hypothetical protein BGI41_04840 [Methanobrevibacter sp. 87.7]|uniref:KEOPS complex subunit Pcc1 n=1 Tax=Methanobrevibacter sp. 87.7 TaxID=387957 RepID=UPI000B51046F|nr:KEOPS complex subunit Pcc1 [Methanobrevibacter sp. 87.7]OWT32963.1 hypothetical protein BGI41_04840 [Methanobrevibacter sp. 87.7]